MGVSPVTIDILPEIQGITFDTAWKNRTTIIVDPDGGLTAHFISRSDLIKAKLAAGRPQDLADVDARRRAGAVKVTKPSINPSQSARRQIEQAGPKVPKRKRKDGNRD